MSLDVYLYVGDECVFDANITLNLGVMAKEAGIYACLWRPDENNMEHARDIIEPLEKGLALMVTHKRRFEEFDAQNGWGLWKNFVLWCAKYLQACRDYPGAEIVVIR